MEQLKERLMAIEREFWLGGADAYREHVDDECLLAFLEMAGIATREQVADSVKDDERWADVRIELVGLLEPSKGVALMTYEASATRLGGQPYAALVSSGYVRRKHGWKLTFHQQTPRAMD